jgi:hypothetical protein
MTRLAADGVFRVAFARATLRATLAFTTLRATFAFATLRRTFAFATLRRTFAFARAGALRGRVFLAVARVDFAATRRRATALFALFFATLRCAVRRAFFLAAM